jgi:hypothetical protein
MCYGADCIARCGQCGAKKGVARKRTGSTMLHGLQGLLLYSAHPRTTIDAPSLLHRQRTSTASHHVLRGRPYCPLRSEKGEVLKRTGSTRLDGLQGLLLHSAHRRTTIEKGEVRKKQAPVPLHKASRTSRPASTPSSPTDYDRRSITAASTTDFDGFSSCATGPTVLPAAKRKKARCGKDRLHKASRTSRPASPLSSPTDYDRRSITAASTTDFDGFSSVAGWGRAGGWLRQHHRRHPADRHPTSTTPSSALYWPPSGSRLLPVALLRSAGRLAGSDDNIFCTLRAAVRQSAPAGCRAAARGEARWLRLHHVLHSAGRHPAAGPGRLQGCGALGVPAPTTPCSVICEQLSGNRLRLAVGGCSPSGPPLHYMAPPPALEPDHNLPYVHNPSHGPNTYTCCPLWRIYPQPGRAAFILSAAID